MKHMQYNKKVKKFKIKKIFFKHIKCTLRTHFLSFYVVVRFPKLYRFYHEKIRTYPSPNMNTDKFIKKLA